MGYFRDSRGRLCCDVCGQGGATKRKCPFGWCQPTALCSDPACKAKRGKIMGKEAHRKRGCEANAAKLHARLQLKAKLLDEGKAVLCSAMAKVPQEMEENGLDVHVLFEKKDGTTIGLYMSSKTYNGIERSVNVTTSEDYEKAGKTAPAPGGFYGGVTTKRVG